MTDTPEQTVGSGALIARLEAAKLGSQYLDREIGLALFPPDWRDDPDRDGVKWNKDAYKLAWCEGASTSIDAAVSLTERVLPGWWWAAGRCGLTWHASVGPDRAFIAEPDLSKYDAGFHVHIPNPSTPAIALCVAILKAITTLTQYRQGDL